jgi:hypothetical protein
MPSTDAIDFEREFEELVRELRALPTAAPDRLRTRVRALDQAPRSSGRWERLRGLSIRRAVFVLAPVCVAGLLAAAVVDGLLTSGPKREAVATVHGESAAAGGADLKSQPQVHGWGALRSATIPAPAADRYQDYEAWMTVRVADVDALTNRTNEAMRAVRSFGGYVASVEQSTAAGQPGRADLVLRVPVARVQDVLVRLSGLGTVVERHLSIRDLEQVVRQQRARIARLRLLAARLTATLGKPLAADVRIRLQLQLEEARLELARATSSNKSTLREAALSQVSLTLTTQKPVGAAAKPGMGRIERAARNAGSFLASAGAVLLFVLIVVSPLAVLGAAAAWGTRIYRAREQRRLLA